RGGPGDARGRGRGRRAGLFRVGRPRPGRAPGLRPLADLRAPPRARAAAGDAHTLRAVARSPGHRHLRERGGAVSAPTPAEWPPPRLRLDVNGDWFDGDEQITHPGLLANLRANLRREQSGRGILRLGGREYPLRRAG